MASPIRVAIADDHQGIIDGYLYRFERLSRIEVVGTAMCGQDLEVLLAKHPADVLILDVGLPISLDKKNNPYPILHAIPNFLQQYRDLIILVISMHTQRTLIDKVLKAGAKGYIVKDDQQSIKKLDHVIELVANGGFYVSPQASKQWLTGWEEQAGPSLTQRQLEVLSLCAAHPEFSSRQLAKKLNVEPSTVRNLLSEAYRRLKVRNRINAVDKARELGLITPQKEAYELSLRDASP